MRVAFEEVPPGGSRNAVLYVFALLAERDPERVDPLNVDRWRFDVVPTAVLNEQHPGQGTIGLAAVERRSRAIRYSEIYTAVRRELAV